jgi:hypothetical protein
VRFHRSGVKRFGYPVVGEITLAFEALDLAAGENAAALAAAAAVFSPGQRDLTPRRRAVITANPELQEREALKRAGLAAMTPALRERGLPQPAATLAAELGVLAFQQANAHWANPANQKPFDELAGRSLHRTKSGVAGFVRVRREGLAALPHVRPGLRGWTRPARPCLQR